MAPNVEAGASRAGGVLAWGAGEPTGKWFKGMPEEVKKQFNLKTIGELHETPLIHRVPNQR